MKPKTLFSTLPVFCFLFSILPLHAENLTELGVEDDITVLGRDGTASDPDVEIKGFTVFGSTQSSYTGIVAGSGSVVINGYLSISSGAYFVGNSTFTGAGGIFITDGSAGQLLQKSGSGNLIWISSSAVGDNLGNHVATTTLNMANFNIVGVSTISVSSITTAGAGVIFSTNAYFMSGNVGIGTTGPNSKLYVGGNTTVAGSQQSLQVSDGVTTTVSLGLATHSTAQTPYVYGNTVLAFGTNVNERVRIDGSGNVGIGTVSPGAKLHTVETSGSSSYIFVASTATDSGSYKMVVSTTGNVGIGTTGPGALFDITGDGSTVLFPRKSTTGNPAGSNGMVYYNTADGKFRCYQNSAWIDCIGGAASSISAGDSNVTVTDTGDGYVTFTEDASERMRITGGNVGVGTNAPAAPLHISAGAATTGAQLFLETEEPTVVADDVLGDFEFRGLDSGTRTGARIRALATDAWGPDTNNAGTSLQFFTQDNTVTDSLGSPRMVISYLGNVGIGTTGPGGRLNVVSSAGVMPLIVSTGSAVGSEVFGINISGNVGIGITNPGAKLEVAGQVKITGGSPGAGRFLSSDAAGLGSWVDVTTGGGWTDDGTVVRLTSAGDNVGIGTTAPGAKLDVAGSGIIQSSLTVQGALGISAPRLLFANNAAISSATPAQYGGVYVSTHVYVSSNVYVGENALYVSGGSTQQVLKKKAAGYLAWDNDIAGVGGTGIQYRIPVWNTDTALSNSVMNQDGGGNSITLLNSTLTVQGNAFSVGGSTLVVSYGNVGIGITNPGAKLEVAGQVKITGGSPGANKVLTSDAAGLASWQPAQGDNLGNHTATADLNMGAFQVTGAGALTMSSITATGIGVSAAQMRLAGNVVISSEAGAALGAGVRLSTNVYIVGFSSATKYYGDGSALTSITALQVPASGVQAGSLGSNVIASSIAVNAVYTNAIANLAVTNAKIDDVAGGKITGAGTIVADRIAAGSLGTGVIASSIAVKAVYTGALADSAVTDVKVSDSISINNNRLYAPDGSGDVGIGTITPGNKLEISFTGSGGGFRLRDSDSNASAAVPYLEFYDQNSRLGYVGYASVADDDFYIQNELSGGDVFLQPTAGNVGIGTTGPGYKLDVNGDMNLAAGMSYRIGGVIQSGTSKWTAGTGNDIYRSLGNVGIGTTGPSERLHVAGNVLVSTAASSPILFASTTTGNVGVGTTAPAGKLEVKGDISNLLYLTRTTDGAVMDLSFFSGTQQEAFIEVDDGDMYLAADGGNGVGLIRFGTRNADASLTEKMRIANTGNVGIGTTGPGYRLVVSSGAGEAGTILAVSTGTSTMIELQGDGEVIAKKFTGDGSGLSGVSGTDNTKVAKAGDTMTGQLTLSGSTLTITGNAFSVGSSTFVVKDGKVGIGTAAPGSRFEVVGGSSTFRGSDSNSAIAGFTDAGGNYRMVISTSGNVGIGLSNPTAKLHVQAYEAGRYTMYASTGDGAGQYSIAVSSTGVTNIKNLVIENRTSDPGNPVTGQIWFIVP